MKTRRWIPLLLVSVLAATPALVAGEASDRFWFGGGIGLGFGAVDFIAVEPVIGYDASEKFSIGTGLIYRYSNDDRFDPDLTTNDYGASVFMRYRFSQSVFLHAEYEYLSYQYRRFDGTKDRDQFESLLAGPGFSQPVGRGGAWIYAMALYNFDHDDANSPYDDPWVYRVGVGIGF